MKTIGYGLALATKTWEFKPAELRRI